jgi:hypothetical protein
MVIPSRYAVEDPAQHGVQPAILEQTRMPESWISVGEVASNLGVAVGSVYQFYQWIG